MYLFFLEFPPYDFPFSVFFMLLLIFFSKCSFSFLAIVWFLFFSLHFLLFSRSSRLSFPPLIIINSFNLFIIYQHLFIISFIFHSLSIAVSLFLLSSCINLSSITIYYFFTIHSFTIYRPLFITFSFFHIHPFIFFRKRENINNDNTFNSVSLCMLS